MQLRTTIVLAAGTAVQAADSLRTSQTSPLALSHPVLGARQLLNCEQTYGAGSLQCGPGESNFCYNPSIGQSCCETDFGFCGSGTYCAPVAGYCCLAEEDLASCAANAGFTLPASASAGAMVPDAASTGGALVPAGAAPTGGAMSPDAPSTSGGPLVPDVASTAAGVPPAATPGAAGNATAAGGRPPYVQVSAGAVGGAPWMAGALVVLAGALLL